MQGAKPNSIQRKPVTDLIRWHEVVLRRDGELAARRQDAKCACCRCRWVKTVESYGHVALHHTLGLLFVSVTSWLGGLKVHPAALGVSV
jgi:hypothetical protein